MTLAIVLLVAGLIIGGGIGYFVTPTKVEQVYNEKDYPVSPIFSTTLPQDLSITENYRVDAKHIIYVWEVSYANTSVVYTQLYWTYVTIGS